MEQCRFWQDSRLRVTGNSASCSRRSPQRYDLRGGAKASSDMTTPDVVSATQSVLDQMTASVVGIKTDRKTQLTPVGLEARTLRVLPNVDAAFPFDHPQEVVLDALKLIREQIGVIEEALRAVETSMGTAEPIVAVPSAQEVQRTRERAADEQHRAVPE